MEEINGYTQELVVGDDVLSWILHSPNVTFARKCVVFENGEFVRNNFEYNNNGTASRKENYSKVSSNVEPRKNREKFAFMNGLF